MKLRDLLNEGDVIPSSDKFGKKREDDATKKKREEYAKAEAERKAKKAETDKVRRERDLGEFQRKQAEQKMLDDQKKSK